MIYRGTIEAISGNWMSGLLTMVISGVTVPCDNGATIRALDACFGNVITEGHTFNPEAVIGKEIFWSYDDMGLTLGGFTPVEEASEELLEYFEAQEVGA